MAGVRDVAVYQGDTYIHNVLLKNSASVAIDITGRTYLAQIRRTKTSSTLIATFTVTITDAAAGTLQMKLTPVITASIISGVYYYDLQETNGIVITTLMGGKVTVSGEVSRA